jgi:tetratricopeptide (TPR) repeat protein
MDELEQAGSYYSRALAKGYRPKTSYDHLEEYYTTAVGDDNKQEAGYTSLIQAFPDSVKYWYLRATNGQRQKHYQEALQDLNHIIKTKSNYKGLEDAYYMRGAVKYRLNPKDTTDAETDRMAAFKLHKMNATMPPYYVYCIVWKNDSTPKEEEDASLKETFRKQEAESNAMIKVHPDSMQYWNDRARAKQQQRNYQGALKDFNELLKPQNNHKISNLDLEYAYYNRGAVKYRLNPKDTTAAEADRMIAIKFHKMNVDLLNYHDYPVDCDKCLISE